VYGSLPGEGRKKDTTEEKGGEGSHNEYHTLTTLALPLQPLHGGAGRGGLYGENQKRTLAKKGKTYESELDNSSTKGGRRGCWF